ncbi:MAG: hypothetical protein H7Z11_15410 [Verrucomicrobia bacterium]|nr:hypothetical protein [Leptolyngbya sp. ES-bin-22]
MRNLRVSAMRLMILIPALLSKREGLLRGRQITVDRTIGLQCVTFQSLNTRYA